MGSETRVLAVDDELRGVELVARILRRTARVATAASGDEAWELCRGEPFDLVISDQRMPGISGVELLARVAESFPGTGRILLTGYAETVDAVEAINRARVHAYLNKPCSPDQLLLTVQTVLDRVAVEQENARLAAELRTGALAGGTTAAGLLDELGSCLVSARQALCAGTGEAATPGSGTRRVTEILGRMEELVEELRGVIDPKRE